MSDPRGPADPVTPDKPDSPPPETPARQPVPEREKEKEPA